MDNKLKINKLYLYTTTNLTYFNSFIQGLNNLNNRTIKMAASKDLANASIIITKCMALRNGVVLATKNSFLNLELEAYSKVIINCYNQNKKKTKRNLHSSIFFINGGNLETLSLNIHK